MKIEINNVTLDTDTLTAEQREQIIVALAEKPKGFRPKNGQYYEILTSEAWSTCIWHDDHVDLSRLACGNCHPVGKGEYLRRRRIAVKAMWDYVAENMPFVPDWGDMGQSKYYPVYNRNTDEMGMSSTCTLQRQFDLPHVSEDNEERFLRENADNLAVIAEGVEKWGM